jgi:hypothetical protein
MRVSSADVTSNVTHPGAVNGEIMNVMFGHRV